MNHLQTSEYADQKPLIAASIRPEQKLATILLVEDESFLREVASEVLEAGGYRVLQARHGAEANEIFKKYGKIIGLLLTDVILPGRNGVELAKQMRKTRPELKAIFISGYAENPITRQSLREQGDYLPKPFSATSLLQKVNEVLAERAS